jgi:hypothetical protein
MEKRRGKTYQSSRIESFIHSTSQTQLSKTIPILVERSIIKSIKIVLFHLLLLFLFALFTLDGALGLRLAALRLFLGGDDREHLAPPVVSAAGTHRVRKRAHAAARALGDGGRGGPVMGPPLAALHFGSFSLRYSHLENLPEKFAGGGNGGKKIRI